jgi:hypothetical protein
MSFKSFAEGLLKRTPPEVWQEPTGTLCIGVLCSIADNESVFCIVIVTRSVVENIALLQMFA